MNKQSRELNSIRNFVAGAINQILMLLLGLFAKNILIKTLGTTFLGLNGLFSNIFILLSFAELGIGSVMVYSLYGPITRNDELEISTIYHFFKKIYIILSIVTMAIGIMIIPFLPLIINVEKAISNVGVYYFLYLTGVSISNIYMYKSQLILADQKNYLLSLFSIFFEGGATLLQILILLKTQSYYLFLIVFIVKNLIYALATEIKVRKIYPFLKEKKLIKQIDLDKKREIYSKIIDVFGYRFARVFITGTDNILISILAGTIWVGYYSTYDSVIMGVVGLVTTFYVGISASVGDFMAKESVEDQYSIFETIQILNMWIVGFTTTCLYILFQDFIELWLGKAYVIDFKIVILIVINYYLVCNRKPITIFREASGMFDKTKRAMFWGAGINIVVSLALGYLIGIYGILLGTIISSLSTYYWYEPKILIKEKFSTSMIPFIKNQVESIMCTCFSIFLTSMTSKVIKDVTISTFIIKICICLIVSNIFYFLILIKKEKGKALIEMAMRNYKKIRKR